MKIVGGYFDSESDATEALDQLMNTPGYENVETRVISSFSQQGNDSGSTAAGPLPQTSGGPNTIGAAIPITGFGRNDLFDELPNEEQRYFNDALRSGRGGVLVLAEVDENHAMEVRSLFSRMGGRTIEENK